MEKQKYYFIYQTTNKLNGKYYIGKHETYNLNDGYVGSGLLLQKAINKYGIENFERTILFFVNDIDSLNFAEKETVTEEVVNDPMSYNLKIGGDGGWDYANKVLTTEERRKHVFDSLTLEQRKFLSDSSKQYWNNMSDDERKAVIQKSSKALKEYYKTHTSAWLGRHHTKETKEKLSKSHIGKIDGNKNPMANRHWWKDPNDKTKSLAIKEGDPVPEGWIRGHWNNDSQEIRKTASYTKGMISITDGKRNTFINPTDKIPEGWRRGQTKTISEDFRKIMRKNMQRLTSNQNGENNPVFGSIWINNGIISKLLKRGCPIPDGWQKGRLPWIKQKS